MPRPSQSNNGLSSKVGESKNPIANWLASFEARRREARNEAAKLITNEAAKNQNMICDKLLAINFDKSALPKEILEQRSLPDQKLCDLEVAAISLANDLRSDTQVMKVDIRKFDQKLLTLVLMFKEAVEQGDPRAAYAAKGAIHRAINEIRGRIPQVDTSLFKAFVETNTNYLEDWVNLVSMAQVADRKKRNLIEKRRSHEKRVQDQQDSVVELRNTIMKDKGYSKAYLSFKDGTLPKEKSKWNPDQRKVHKFLIEARMNDVVVDLSGYRLQQLETQQAIEEGKIEMLKDSLLEIEVVDDPNRMEKFLDSVERMSKKMAVADQEIKQNLEVLDKIDGIIRGLDNAEGAVKAQEEAIMQAGVMLERVDELQRSLNPNPNTDGGSGGQLIREKLGVYTDEELAAQFEEQAQQQEQTEEEQQEQTQEQTQNNQNYN